MFHQSRSDLSRSISCFPIQEQYFCNFEWIAKLCFHLSIVQTPKSIFFPFNLPSLNLFPLPSIMDNSDHHLPNAIWTCISVVTCSSWCGHLDGSSIGHAMCRIWGVLIFIFLELLQCTKIQLFSRISGREEWIERKSVVIKVFKERNRYNHDSFKSWE